MQHYRKIELKGKGSYGQAILVQNKQDRKFYIMKIIDAPKFDIKEKENALNQIDVLKNQHHPCIIQYRESFVDKNKYLCIVMDYAEEGTLHQRLEQQKQKQEYLKESQIIQWFTQICLAIKYIHDKLKIFLYQKVKQNQEILKLLNHQLILKISAKLLLELHTISVQKCVKEFLMIINQIFEVQVVCYMR